MSFYFVDYFLLFFTLFFVFLVLTHLGQTFITRGLLIANEDLKICHKCC